MVFNSFAFFIFFVVVYALYCATMPRLRWQNWLLLVASYFFYGWWDYRFLSLLGFSTVIDWFFSQMIDRRNSAHHGDKSEDAAWFYSVQVRRVFLALSIISNLLVLGFFKYYDFFASSLNASAESLGIHLSLPILNVILPVGISFYTFQSLSYTIDVYRGHLRAVPNLLDFAVYVAFFPQLVAGPIVRAVDLLPQIQRPRLLNREQMYAGAWLIFWGLFKKVALADNLALIVEPVFGAGRETPDGQLVLIATYAFAVQIYCDFSGYTDVARGCAKLMGFEFGLNFNLPYLASNPREFWQRWHISLSTWLRDYLYIPLGGNRHSRFRTCVNLIITMVLGGLWHGAAWTYVLWGFYQGALLVVHRLTEPWCKRLSLLLPTRTNSLRRGLAIAVFFHLTCLGWLIFRAQSVEQIATLLGQLFTLWPWWVLCGANPIHGAELTCLLGCVLPLVAMQYAQYFKNDLQFILRAPVMVRGMVYTAIFYAMVWYGVNDARPFIYFQF